MPYLYISLQNKFHLDIFIFGLVLTYLKKYNFTLMITSLFLIHSYVVIGPLTPTIHGDKSGLRF